MGEKNNATQLLEQPSREKLMNLLLKQVQLLDSWNQRNIYANPEQVRKNTETQYQVSSYLLAVLNG